MPATRKWTREDNVPRSARAGLVFPVGRVHRQLQDQTPLAVPLWEGHTYKTLPASFIPRILWPNKPSKQVGQDFGHRYSIIAPHDKSTAVNLPQLVELFINFGTRGMLLGMLALGVLYRLIYRKLNAAEVGDGTIIIAATIFSVRGAYWSSTMNVPSSPTLTAMLPPLPTSM